MHFTDYFLGAMLILSLLLHQQAYSWQLSTAAVTRWKTQIQKIAAATAVTATFIAPLTPLSIIPMNPAQVNAVIAPIADVGVREFLVKDGNQFLRLTIPLGKAQKFGSSQEALDMKTAQENLELVKLRFEQVGFTNPTAWGAALKDANTAGTLIKNSRELLVQQSRDPVQAQKIFDDQLSLQLSQLSDAIRERNIERTAAAQSAAAQALADLRLLQLPAQSLPFEIPSEYNLLPRLQGRATVELLLQSKSGAGYRLPDGKTVVQQLPLTLVVDGYSTPLTAGNFVDLVNKKFYDGMPLQRVEQQLIQTGRSTASSASQTTATKSSAAAVAAERRVPLELQYKRDNEPVFGITSDDDMRATETFAHPFQAYGALGMARDNEDPDSGNSQFFFFKWDQALNPPGRNTIDGFYSCFGYTTSNADLLKQAQLGDKIVYAKVVKGIENLQLP